jgi:glycosyltransferase involved in cell wall biosynthesis
MRIGLVNSFFPPWRGGAETYTFSLAKALSACGHEVTVICGSDPHRPGTYRQHSITIRRLHILTRIYGTPIMPSLPEELHRRDVEILHANFPSPYIAFNVAVASLSRYIPAVLTWHNDLPAVTSGARFLVQAHDRFVLPKYIRAYRRVISTSESYAKRSPILSALGDLVTLVPNGVDCTRYHPKVSGQKIRDNLSLGDRFTILFVGALTTWHRYKGLDILLEALKLSLKTQPDLMLLVVGDGELKQFYCSMSRKLGLEMHVNFAGDVPDILLPQYYAASDALVLPSKDMSEGFGLTLLEANASGKPVIASNVGGIPSVVRCGHNGFLVEPNNPRDLAKAILRLQENPRKTREMGRNGRRFAESHDWKVTASQTERVYREILSADR